MAIFSPYAPTRLPTLMIGTLLSFDIYIYNREEEIGMEPRTYISINTP